MQLATLTPGLSISMVNEVVCKTNCKEQSIFMLGVTVEVFDGNLTVGSNVTLRCLSDNGVADRIEWRSGEGHILNSGNLTDQMDLHFLPVNDSLHDSNITCFVTRDEGRANQTVSNQTFSISVRGGCSNYNA